MKNKLSEMIELCEAYREDKSIPTELRLAALECEIGCWKLYYAIMDYLPEYIPPAIRIKWASNNGRDTKGKGRRL